MTAETLTLVTAQLVAAALFAIFAYDDASSHEAARAAMWVVTAAATGAWGGWEYRARKRDE